MKRGRLRPVSKSRRRETAARARVVAFVLARDEHCRARGVITGHECWGPLDVHERIPRSAWKDGYLDPENCIAICRGGHEWVDANIDAAVELGLLGKSWHRTDPVWLQRRDLAAVPSPKDPA